ncbi:hypothetical protein CTA2_4685 [Colletotrichum tanaceti]|uniref:Apple domain-containing protein n=1 Tax=Colletotrichum tanaceti TaxID=1306861 RepID=A0A4U6XVU6_9PEZI|nr:hypothetical protein CTA2_4685 [Colletotrichum tanaceti]TKW60104.1 hypothetical protein CTA1_4884 [Colletotrichum tanaceti]
MQYALLLTAALLSEMKTCTENVDLTNENQVAAHAQSRNARPDLRSGEWAYPVAARGRTPFSSNGTASPAGTGTTSASSSSAFSLPHNVTSSTNSSHQSGCPQSTSTSTTTVDVTFYITATTSYGDNATSSSGTGTGFASSSVSSHTFVNSTTSQAIWNTSSTSVRLSTGYTLPVNSSYASTVSSVAGSGSSCSDNTASTQFPYPNITSSLSSHYSRSSLATGGSSGTITSVPAWHNSASAGPSQTTEPCDDDLSSTSLSNSTSTATSTQLNSTAPLSTGTPKSAAQVTSCDDTSSGSATANHPATATTSKVPHINSTAAYTLSTKTQKVTSSQPVLSSTTEWDDEPSASTLSTGVPSSIHAVSSSWTARLPTVTPFLPNTISLTYSTHTMTVGTTSADSSYSSIPTESCVIDTSMVPVTSAPLTSVPTPTLIPTKTVCQDDAPTGKPKPGNNHCGVHGLPVGNYFLARFVENAPGLPVTLEGCYQFCASVMSATNGCKSYRFYPERGLNVPRCDLYGSSVAYALNSINNDHPDMWFDLTCGSPSDERWASLPGMTRLGELGLLR